MDKVSRAVAAHRVTTTSDEEDLEEIVEADVIMDDESDVPPEKPKRKRREKKVIPIGKNGLKKKRIVKSRMTMDEKGYMGQLNSVSRQWFSIKF